MHEFFLSLFPCVPVTLVVKKYYERQHILKIVIAVMKLIILMKLKHVKRSKIF